MKVYQLIYTSVLSSLSDPELGLTNRSGLRVFSCSQGITKDNIDEIIRFATYRLPKNNDIIYSAKPCDPSVPELFPKIFRTLRLSDGRYVAMQISYAGYDFDGQIGNVFAHAFVFDDVDDDFIPERYFGHPMYRTHLEEKALNGQIVHYLKPLDDIQPTEGLEEKVIEFVSEHKNELTYILDKAMRLLTSDDIKNICIATNEAELTQMYLLALKWLLPRDGAENLGISTYNVYLPSDKQKQIVFHGTIKGKNNITQQAIEVRRNCIYIDIENTRFERDTNSMLFRFGVKELRDIYAKYKFTSAPQLLAWEATNEDITQEGIASKLIKLKKTAGDEAFTKRVMEIYPSINDLSMAGVRFELSQIMFENLHLFEDKKKDIAELYMWQCLERICAGDTVNMGNPFDDEETAKDIANEITSNIGQYMEEIRINLDLIPEKNKLLLLQLFGSVKHAASMQSWRELFTDKEDLKLFVHIASELVITGAGMSAFTNIEGWLSADLAEVIAFFDSSTRDHFLKKSCLKYIYAHQDEDWEKYGVSLKKHEKSKGAQEADIEKIRRMLSKVGYIPYQKETYQSIKGEVNDDVRSNNSPLLISRLLYAVYRWQGSYGNQIEAEKNAKTVREFLLEMRETQKSCYDFIIPKLALEIIESPCHYHEIIVNTETMPRSFWDWFLIGYEKCSRDDDKILNYTRVYMASKANMQKIPARKKLNDVFSDIAQ